MPKVIWLPEALQDAQRLRLFLEDKNPNAAARLARVFQKGANLLADYPEVGRPMNDDTDRRELFLPFGVGGYVLRYIIDKDKQTAAIIRVWHNREKRADD